MGSQAFNPGRLKEPLDSSELPGHFSLLYQYFLSTNPFRSLLTSLLLLLFAVAYYSLKWKATNTRSTRYPLQNKTSRLTQAAHQTD